MPGTRKFSGVKQGEPVLCQLHTHCRIWSLEDGWQTSLPRQAEIWPHQPTAPLPQAYWNSFIAPPKQSTEKQNDKPKLTSPSHSCICTHSPSLGQAPKHVLNMCPGLSFCLWQNSAHREACYYYSSPASTDNLALAVSGEPVLTGDLK